MVELNLIESKNKCVERKKVIAAFFYQFDNHLITLIQYL